MKRQTLLNHYWKLVGELFEKKNMFNVNKYAEIIILSTKI